MEVEHMCLNTICAANDLETQVYSLQIHVSYVHSKWRTYQQKIHLGVELVTFRSTPLIDTPTTIIGHVRKQIRAHHMGPILFRQPIRHGVKFQPNMFRLHQAEAQNFLEICLDHHLGLSPIIRGPICLPTFEQTMILAVVCSMIVLLANYCSTMMSTLSLYTCISSFLMIYNICVTFASII